MAEIKKKTCFVITPVGNDEDPIRRQMDGIINAVLTPVLGDDYEILVSHRLPDTGSVHKQEIQYIYDSDLVIANLTKKHPNVIYELAFRHSIGAPVIMIAEKGTSLPYFFAEEVIYYINDAQGVLELIESLITHLDLIDYSKDRIGPIYDALRDTSKEEYLVKKIEKEYRSLADIGSGDEIEEINETEYAFFRDLLKEAKPASIKPDDENDIPKSEAPEDAAREMTEPVTLEQISRNSFSFENEAAEAENAGSARHGGGKPDEPESEFLNGLSHHMEAEFSFIRETIQETKNEIGNEHAPNPDSLKSIFDEYGTPKSAAGGRGTRNVPDIMEWLDRIESRISEEVIFSENRFKDLIEKNEHLNRLISSNNLYFDKAGLQNKRTGSL